MRSIDPSRRSSTWPPTMIRVAPSSISRGFFTTYMSSPDLFTSRPASSSSASSVRSSGKSVRDPFEDELDEHPDAHFLSPVQMYEYEDWASDSDGDDEEEVAWDAGITDFALFDSDRRRAEERQEALPDHWEGLRASQAKALQRSVERNRANQSPDNSHPLLEDVPQLTPDNSPQLRDQMDMETPKPTRPKAITPQYQRHSLSQSQPSPKKPTFHFDSFSDEEELDDSPSSLSSDDDDSDYETPISILIARARAREERRKLFPQNPLQQQHRLLRRRRLDRPGLRYNRTMSGKVHVWRRPELHIYPVGEDVEAEREAEIEFEGGN